MEGGSSSRAVIEYYDDCHTDYRMVWRSHRNLCIHFGYFDAQHRSHEQGLVNMNRVLAERVGITSRDHVLDAGCGIGGSSIWLALNRGARVSGVNIQPLHVRLAREEARQRGVEGLVRFEQRDYCDTGLPDAGFDVLWALESVCHAPDKNAFVREAHRLLREGGRIVVADFFQFKPELDPAERRRMRGWLDGWALPHLAPVNEFQEYLASSGFEDVRFEDITAHVMPSSRRLYAAGLLTLPFAKPLELLGVRTKRQTANVAACYHQYRTIAAGLWGYGIFTGRKPGPPAAGPGLSAPGPRLEPDQNPER